MVQVGAGLELDIQKILLLATGVPADPASLDSLTQLAASSGTAAVEAVAGRLLWAQAGTVGAETVVQQVAWQALGVRLPAGSAHAVASVLDSPDTWAALVHNVLAIGGAAGAALLDKAQAASAFTAALIAQDKAALYGGSPTLLASVRAVLQGVTADPATVAEGQSGLAAIVQALGPGGLSVSVADGYLVGASVFEDFDGDGMAGADELVGRTDAWGRVDLPPLTFFFLPSASYGADAGGSLLATGGTDLLTGRAFQGWVSAPLGSTTVNPLTTVIDAMLRSGQVESAQAGSTTLERALGLDPSLNLLTYDPLPVLASRASTAAAAATALGVQKKILEVTTVLTLGGALVHGMTPAVTLEQAVHDMADALAALAAGGQALGLSGRALAEAVLTDGWMRAVGSAPAGSALGNIGEIARLVAELNQRAEDSGSLYALAKLTSVAKFTVVNAVEGALANGSSMTDVVSHYTGDPLNREIENGQTDQIIPGVPVRPPEDPDPAPAPSPAPAPAPAPGPAPNTAPTITAPAAALSIAENTTAVGTVTAVDAQGDAVTFSITGGADAALFTINAATGVLALVGGRDFEAPTDVGANNVYDVTVRASDGVLSSTKAIAVTITNVNDNTPAITSNGGGAAAALNIAENTTAVTTVTASDADGDALTYSIAGGADAALFAINATTGVLTFASGRDFETPTDVGANNVYDVTVRASDGTNTRTQAIAVTVTNANDNTPAITSSGGGATAALNVAENTTAVTTVTATDADGDALTYSIAGGADAALFAINATTGVLSFASGRDFETPTDAGANNVYDVTVRASDGTNSRTQAIAVTVTNVNESPAITSNGGGATASIAVAENTTPVTTMTATDPEGGALTYSLAGGADAALFSINGATGVLTFTTARDFETPTDAGTNNVYDLVVRASDGALSSTQSLAVTITNVNEAPSITSNGAGATASVSVAENATAVTTVTASDPDGNALTYSITGGADAALFTINASTGALTFASGRNFESPTDAGANNVYDVTVRASDGILNASQSIAVTVTNVNEAPAITSNGGGASAAITVNENNPAVTTVAAADPEGSAVTYSISGGADAAKFTINATTGVLAFATAPNFEVPTDVGADNVYDVQVSASDGALSSTQAIAVTVADVAEVPVLVLDEVYYSGLSAASTVILPKEALFYNDSGETLHSTWALTNVTNTPTGGTASGSGANLSLSGFDTAGFDSFGYQATDANGTSLSVNSFVKRVASTNITGTASGDVILGGNAGGTLNGGIGGKDYIVGGTGADTLVGGVDADDMTGGGGADLYVFTEGTDGVAPTAVNFALGASATTFDDGDTWTFGNGVDVVRGFVSGTDQLDVSVANSVTALAGVAGSASLGAGNNYSIRGTYNELTKVFAAAAAGADLLVLQGGGVTASAESDYVVLVGVTSIAAGDFA